MPLNRCARLNRTLLGDQRDLSTLPDGFVSQQGVHQLRADSGGVAGEQGDARFHVNHASAGSSNRTLAQHADQVRAVGGACMQVGIHAVGGDADAITGSC